MLTRFRLSALAALPLGLLLTAASCGAPAGPVSESGSLEVGDQTLSSGEYQDTYTVQLKEGQWLDVDLRAEGFDPYLIVAMPSGEQSDMDDSVPGDTTSVRMVLRAQEAGEHRILVTSYSTGETGSYKLTYEVSDTQPPGAAGAAPDSDPLQSAPVDTMAAEPAETETI
jgi:hypothetical protein